jgi:hypothetical protein
MATVASIEASSMQSITLSLPVIMLGCLGGSAAVLANLFSFMMIGKINERLPDNERVSYLWWGTNVRARFKQLYPGDRLVFLLDCSVGLMVLSFIVLIRLWVFG